MQERVSKGARRRHSAELKRQVVEACGQPGASVAAVAMAHGLNANMVHRWLREGARNEVVSQGLPTQASFVALPLNTALGSGSADIRVEVRRGTGSVTVHWPVGAAGACAGWLREWLK